MPWDMLIFGLGSYFLGIWVTKYEARKKKERVSWSSKVWTECRTCYPGVVMKFGANNHHELQQVVSWHLRDHHEIEKEGVIQKAANNPYAGTYVHPKKELKLRSNWNLREKLTAAAATIDTKRFSAYVVPSM